MKILAGSSATTTLRSRRARVAPESVGIAAGPRRRVPGLRREELAQLAGISVDYYVRLEQGRATQPSVEILDARATFPDWDQRAKETVAVLRLAAGRHADDERLRELVGRLSVHSEDFRTLWAAGDVLVCGSGTRRFRHAVVGELTLRYETLQLPTAAGQAGQELHVFSSEQGSDAEEALQLLANWTTPPREHRR
jgi:hypothetical protein